MAKSVDWSVAQQEVSRLAYRHSRDFGVSQKEGYAEALREVAEQYDMSEEELNKGLGVYRQSFRQTKKRPASASNGRTQTNSPQVEDSPLSLTDVYRAWCANNDVIPTDNALAHFTERAVGTWAKVRDELKREGWVFDGDKNGWRVTVRPPFLSISAEDIAQAQRMVAEAKKIEEWLKRIGKATTTN